MLVIGALTGAGFVAHAALRGGRLSVYDGPGAFLPERAVHAFDWAMGIALFALLLVNCARMWWFAMRREGEPRRSAATYLRHLALLPVHFFTQRRWTQCKTSSAWGGHLALMLSYVTMLVLIVFFLPEMQHGPDVRWGVHVFGYIAAIGLLVGTTLALRGRITRQAAHHRHSHASDWIFLGMLLALAVTGVVQHVLHRAGLPTAANLAYLVHLMVVAPFEITQVPFGKWSHMAYRPLAIYLARVQDAAHAASAEALERPATSLRTA
jgi:quinone-modifying oxidoreductase subunit QmoC